LNKYLSPQEKEEIDRMINPLAFMPDDELNAIIEEIRQEWLQRYGFDLKKLSGEELLELAGERDAAGTDEEREAIMWEFAEALRKIKGNIPGL